MIGATLAPGAIAGSVFAANLGIATHRYGLEYLRRLAVWGRREDMGDPERFPARPIAPAEQPYCFQEDLTGPTRVRLAFREVAPRHGSSADEPFEAFLARTGSTSLLVLDRDRLAFEAYANGAGRGSPLTSMSMAKSVLGLMAVAAVADGLIPNLDAPAESLLPEVPGLRGSGVSLRHLLRMASGLAYESAWPLHRLTWPLLFDGFRVAYFTPDIRRYIATARPGRHPPGARFDYDDRGAQLVGWALTRAYGCPLADAFGARLWRRIGAAYPASWNLDQVGGLEKMESGLNAAALDWLKLGRLVLHAGRWRDNNAAEQVVLPASLVTQAITAAGQPPDPLDFYPAGSSHARQSGFSYGLLWYVLEQPSPEAGGAPPDCCASGLFGQVLYVARKRGAVLLRTGLRSASIDWAIMLADLAAALPPANPGT